MLSQQSVGLFLDPGLGKTSTVLAAFKILQDEGYVEKMLLIAPLRPMYSTWPDEIAKWDDFNHFTYTFIHGPDKAKALSKDVDIYMINPEGLVWLIENHPKFFKSMDVLCVDESSKFKRSTTKRFKALRKVLPALDRRWCLTGTPVPNGIMDLFGQVYILDQGATLGKFITHYRNQYFNQTGFGGYTYELRDGAFEEIVHKIDPLVIQLSAKDYLDMPDLVHVNRVVHLPQEAYEKYKEVEDEFITMLEGEAVVAANAAAAGTKCRQIANGAVYTNDEHDWSTVHDAKLDALEELVEELGGAPAIIFYEFQHDAVRIQQRFDVTSLTGVSGQEVSLRVNRFNAGRIPLLLGHPASMGHGLNLQGSCHHVIWFGITWNLEHYDQAIARVYRQGQASDTVFNYHLVAESTLDVRVLEVLRSKNRNQQALLKALAG